MAGKRYSVKKNRINSGYHPGFELTDDGVLKSDTGNGSHYLYLRAIDSGELDSSWGRLCMDVEYPDTAVLTIYAVAMNEDSFYRKDVPTRIDDFMCDPEEGYGIKREFFDRVSAKKFVNQSDCLLYELSGRYLYLAIEVSGDGDIAISNIRIDQQGDIFMDTFPEVYVERGSFFHRYLSIFSTLYNDFQEKIDSLDELLDLDKCPAEFLPIYAGWLGIEVSEDIVGEEWFRELVKEAYQLSRIKGTKRALHRICEIVLGEYVLVLEGSAVREYINESNKKEMQRLYGSTPYDVTILIKHPVSEALTSKLLFLLNQYKPVRCVLHIVGLHAGGTLDTHSYLDMNAQVASVSEGKLDDKQAAQGIFRLS